MKVEQLMSFQSLAATHKKITQSYRSLFYEFYLFSVAFSSYYLEAVADEINKLKEIQQSENMERTDIITVVESAAKVYYSVHWWPLFRLALKKRFRVQAVAYFCLVLSFLIFEAFTLLPSIPHPVQMNSYSAWFMIIVFIVLLILNRLFYSKISYPNKAGILFILGGACTIIGTHAFSIWASHATAAWESIVSSYPTLHQDRKTQLASIPIAHLLQWALWFTALVLYAVCFRRIVMFFGKVIVSEKKFGYGVAAEAHAEAILRLVDIRHYLNKIPSDNYPNCKRNNRCLQCRLGTFAIFIRGPWRKTMHAHYRPAGDWIASQAPRIELFIRHQQTKNMLLSGNLFKLRDAMTVTLVNAGDGNWHLIGTEEEYTDKATARRRSVLIRRAIAVGASIIVAIAVPHFLRHYPTLYIQGIVITCIGFATVELLGILDPDAPSRLDIAGRMSNIFKRGNG